METKLFFKGSILYDRDQGPDGVTLTFPNLKHEVLHTSPPTVLDVDTGATRELTEHEALVYETALEEVSNHFLAATLAKLVSRR